VIASDALPSPIAVSDFPPEDEGPSSSQGVVIIDAGGGTINLSAYSMKLSPTSFEEIAPAKCRFFFYTMLFLTETSIGCLQGPVFVIRRAHTLSKSS
jgi:hypothetical protein